jgi:hypothetical protein
MDEFGIWNRVLSQSEVTQLYNNSAGKSYPFPNTVNSAPAIKIGNLLTDLECYYAMDGSLGYAKDYSPKHRDASINGLIYQDSSGVINTGFKWDSSITSNNYLVTPEFSFVEELSFNVWLYPSSAGLFTIICDGHQSSTTGFLFSYMQNNNLVFQYAPGGSKDTFFSTDFFLGFINTWVMATIVVNYSTSTVKFYRNGTLYSSVTKNIKIFTDHYLSKKYIGSNQLDNPGICWRGNMDEFGIWSRLLSPYEIKQLYNAGSGKAFPFTGSQSQTAQLKLVDPLLDRIQAYYPLNDSSNNIIDVTGNGRNGVNDGATPLQPGKIGTCYKFNDATADQLVFGSKGITTQTGISCACWFNSFGSIAYDTIIRIGAQWNSPFHWLYIIGDSLNWQTSNFNTKGFYGVGAAYVIPLNTWVHLAVTHNYATGEVIFYINGSILAIRKNSEVNPSPCHNTVYSIGSYSATAHPFNGYIDEVGIWAKALTSDDVSRLYNNGNGLTYPFR